MNLCSPSLTPISNACDEKKCHRNLSLPTMVSRGALGSAIGHTVYVNKSVVRRLLGCLCRIYSTKSRTDGLQISINTMLAGEQGWSLGWSEGLHLSAVHTTVADVLASEVE